MKWEMEVLSSYLSNSTWLIDESRNAKWTPEENKQFENALAFYDKETPDRWQKVAAMIPGKTVGDVIKQYKALEDDVSNIEAGLVSVPDYNTPSSAFSLVEWVDHNGYEGYKYTYGPSGKRGPGQERKKGVPWTEDEHKLFLLGLQKYGKGDWRNISRNFVVTRTPTQVASHAQKYFIRQLSGGKDKRRASIHDITTVNLDTEALSPDNTNHSKRSNSPETNFQWDQHKSDAGGDDIALNDSIQGNMFISSNITSFGSIIQEQNFQRGDLLQNYIGSQGMGFQIQPTQNYSHG